VIAGKMPGRTDNEIKNYWNSRIRKRQQNTNASGEDGGGCAKQGGLSAADTRAFDLAPPPAGEIKPVCSGGTTAVAPPVPARFPMFACQLIGSGGGGGDAAIAAAGTTQSRTTHENNGAGSESEVSVGGEDGWGNHHYYCAGGGADIDMVHLLSFDDFLQYPAEELLMDAWDQSEVYCTNSGSSDD
jgi:myb proto-oncogene protein